MSKREGETERTERNRENGERQREWRETERTERDRENGERQRER